jgi:AcrR family transcriptional regulator
MSFGDERKQEKKRLIIEAAVTVFAQKGYAGTKMADIADCADIGKGTIYEYFRSKADLFYHIFEWYLGESNVIASIGLSSLKGGIARQLEALNESILAYMMKIKPLYGLMFEFLSASTSPEMHERIKKTFRREYGHYRELLADMIKKGIEGGEFITGFDPDAVAATVVGAWDALGLQFWLDDRFDLMTAGRDTMSVIIRGMSVSKT